MTKLENGITKEYLEYVCWECLEYLTKREMFSHNPEHAKKLERLDN